MAVVSMYDQITLGELSKRLDPRGNTAVIAEVLAQDNEFLLDAAWLEANGATVNKITRRASLPTGDWRKLNAGVSPEASQTVEVLESIGMLEAYSEVDKDLVNLAPSPRAFRMGEAAAFIEGMSQDVRRNAHLRRQRHRPRAVHGPSAPPGRSCRHRQRHRTGRNRLGPDVHLYRPVGSQ